MVSNCGCESSDILVLPCSGAANCGQIANEIALRLRDNGAATPYCTVGIGGHVKGIVEGAKSAKVLVAIDGCAVACAKKCLEGENLKPTIYFVVADGLGIKKDKVRPNEEDIGRGYDEILSKIRALCSKGK
jgi:uncharacterized metal-binding protein